MKSIFGKKRKAETVAAVEVVLVGQKLVRELVVAQEPVVVMPEALEEVTVERVLREAMLQVV